MPGDNVDSDTEEFDGQQWLLERDGGMWAWPEEPFDKSKNCWAYALLWADCPHVIRRSKTVNCCDKCQGHRAEDSTRSPGWHDANTAFFDGATWCKCCVNHFFLVAIYPNEEDQDKMYDLTSSMEDDEILHFKCKECRQPQEDQRNAGVREELTYPSRNGYHT